LDHTPLLQNVQVRGELSNYKFHAPSGHHYFTLKDETGQLKAAMFRGDASRLRFRPADGMRVIARGQIRVFERQGQYQLYVADLRYDGTGALFAAFEALRRKLEQEGLFDRARKRPLPRFPACIGLVTSPTGAAVRDMTTILRRRWPGAEVILCPALVQGEEAADSLVRALRLMNQQERVEVILLGRGGGSLEDLTAFNEEKVARAIFASRRPVISAVGHETDVTIADLVADARAPTPSGAAEMAVPDRGEVIQHAASLAARLDLAWQRRVEAARQRLRALESRRVWTHPQEQWASRRQAVDELSERQRAALEGILSRQRERLTGLEQTLQALSPLQVLERGYSVFRRYPQGDVIRRLADVQVGERGEILLRDGRVVCRVEQVGPAR
jgi:exodeoxyribonuclease VII large subunit